MHNCPYFFLANFSPLFLLAPENCPELREEGKWTTSLLVNNLA